MRRQRQEARLPSLGGFRRFAHHLRAAHAMVVRGQRFAGNADRGIRIHLLLRPHAPTAGDVGAAAMRCGNHAVRWHVHPHAVPGMADSDGLHSSGPHHRHGDQALGEDSLQARPNRRTGCDRTRFHNIAGFGPAEIR